MKDPAQFDEMTPAEVEAWARRVVEAVQAGLNYEDSLVELKSSWPDPGKTAERLAAHANEVAGHLFLWVFGVDAKTRHVQTAVGDQAQWLSKMQAHFDGPLPKLVHGVLFDVSGHVLTALLFDPAEPPYVIKHSDPRISRWVPRREGTALRAASRAELLRILEPLVIVPDLQPLKARWSRLNAQWGQEGKVQWFFVQSVRVSPRSKAPAVLTDARIAIDLGQGVEEISFPAGIASVSFEKKSSPLVHLSENEVTFSGPGTVTFIGNGTSEFVREPPADLAVELRVDVIGSSQPAIAKFRMVAPAPPEPEGSMWRLE